MIEVKDIVTPSPDQWEIAIKGMRNAYKSWDKYDSAMIDYDDVDVYQIDTYINGEKVSDNEDSKYFDNPKYSIVARDEGDSWYFLGEKDKNLLFNLARAGNPSHRKVLRQLPVAMNITAPLYWWKQMDTYKIGTTANSESTMHTMTKVPFKLEDFDIKNFLDIDGEETNWLQCMEYEDSDLWFEGMENDGYCLTPEEYFNDYFVNLLNSLRYFYLKTKDKKYWHAINELLPQSYIQTRTWTANYEVLLNIISQRKNHPLGEWRELIDIWFEKIPLLKELNEVVNGNN